MDFIKRLKQWRLQKRVAILGIGIPEVQVGTVLKTQRAFCRIELSLRVTKAALVKEAYDNGKRGL